LRAFVRFLVAICIGVAGTLAWQAYGGDAKQVIATRAPELGWSPEVKQTIASWTKPLAGPENTAAQPVQETQQAAPVSQTAPEAVAPTPAASIDPEQVKQMAQSLDELRQTVGQLAAAQEQFGREMTRLQAADQEILARIPAPPPPPSPATAPTRKPAAVPPQRTPANSPNP
jgi:cytoskeletal protein RodZ